MPGIVRIVEPELRAQAFAARGQGFRVFRHDILRHSVFAGLSMAEPGAQTPDAANYSAITL